MKGIKFDLTRELNLVECLRKSELVSVRDKDRKNMFCINNRMSPIPNSTADKTRKRNVRDIKFKLSYEIPIDNVIKYKVIHKISAVKSK